MTTAADPPKTNAPRILPPAKNIPTPNAADQAKAQEFYRITRAARQAESDGEWTKALELWLTVQKERPDDYSAYNGIRRSLVSLERFEEALVIIEKAFKAASLGTFGIDPTTIAADKVEVLFASERETEALKEIERLINAMRGAPNVYRSLANVLYAQRRGDDAIELLKRGRQDSEDPYLFAREIAQFAEVRMDWASAVDEYLLYLEESPENLSYVTGTLGDIMSEPGGDTLVQNRVTYRIKLLNRDRIEPFLELQAGLLFRAKKYSASLDAYRELNLQRGGDGKVLYEIAQKFAEENESILALTAFSEFLNSDVPNDVRFRTTLKIARTCETLGMLDSAESCCKSILTPGAPIDAIIEANYHLGRYSLQKQQTPATARKYFETALAQIRKTQPPQGVSVEEIEIALAMTFQLEANFEAARKELEKVVRLAGGRANAASKARIELAKLAFRQGNFEEARKQSDALLMADPSAESSNEALELCALIDSFKESPEVLRLFGQADMMAMLGKLDDAIELLDSLKIKGANSRIIEEAIWRRIELTAKRGNNTEVINDLDLLIALQGEILRKDKALFEAGYMSQTVLSDPARAKSYYDRLLLEFPDSPLAERTRKLAKGLIIQEF